MASVFSLLHWDKTIFRGNESIHVESAYKTRLDGGLLMYQLQPQPRVGVCFFLVLVCKSKFVNFKINLSVSF